MASGRSKQDYEIRLLEVVLLTATVNVSFLQLDSFKNGLSTIPITLTSPAFYTADIISMAAGMSALAALIGYSDILEIGKIRKNVSKLSLKNLVHFNILLLSAILLSKFIGELATLVLTTFLILLMAITGKLAEPIK